MSAVNLSNLDPAARGLRAGESFASIIDLGLNDIVRHYPQGGPQHERAIRYAIALGWNAARHLYRAPDTIPLSSRKAGPA